MNTLNITTEQFQSYRIVGNTWIFEYYRNPKNRFEFIKNPNY